MPARSSAEGRWLLLILNTIPLLHVAGVIALACFSVPLAAALLFLAPPLLARALLILSPIRSRRIAHGTREFFTWWAVFQLQVLFSRLVALEEALRLLPGAYSLWLRLWGARVGRFTYWSPGMRILDRSFIEIGDDVLFGAGVRINPHVLVRDERGAFELILARVRVGDRSVIGGYTTLTAGAEVTADESPRAFTILPPFSRFEGGRRIKPELHEQESEVIA